MSPLLLKRTLAAIWDRYRRAILFVGSLTFVATFFAVYYWRDYWSTVFADSWGLVENLSGGTKVSLAFGAASPVIFWFFRWLFTRRNDELNREFKQEVVKPAILTLIVYVCLVAFYTVFFAQPKMYTRKADEAKNATNEVAKLTPAGSEISYKVLAEELAEKQTALEIEKRARLAAEEGKKETWNLYIGAIASATNNFSEAYMAELDKGIALVNSGLKDLQPANDESIQRILKLRTDLAALEKQKVLAAHTKLVAPFQAIAKYTVSIYQPLINGFAGKCGAVANTISVPSLEFMAANSKTNMAIVDSTNCNWKASCRWSSASLRLEIRGKKAKPGVALLGLNGPTLFTELNVGGQVLDRKECPSLSPEQWIKNVDELLSLFVASQQEEFQ
jgi:hypothetical protein